MGEGAKADRLARGRALHLERVGAALRRAQAAVQAPMAEALAASGLTPGQFELLAAARAAPGLDQAALAALIGIDRSTTTLLADALEARGLIARRAGADRRRRLIDPAPHAATTLAAPLAAYADAARRAEARLGGEACLFLRRLHALAAHPESPAPLWRPEPTSPPADPDLLAALTGHPALLLRRAFQVAGALFEAEAHDHRVTGMHYSILTLLAAGLIEDQSELLAVTGASRSTSVPAIRALEARGLIRRAPAPGDRRRKLLAVTDEGRALAARLRPLAERYEGRFFAPIETGHAAAFNAGLARLMAG